MVYCKMEENHFYLHVAMYFSAPPITSTSLSSDSLLVYEPSPKQLMHTALSLITCSAKGTSSMMLGNPFL